jgi:phosphocarrier protein HPr
MIEKTVKVNNKNGLHMRPAGDISEEAHKYNSSITIIGEDVEANATSILEVSMLGATEGTSLTIRAHGDDEIIALKAIEDLIVKKYDDEII